MPLPLRTITAQEIARDEQNQFDIDHLHLDLWMCAWMLLFIGGLLLAMAIQDWRSR